jgi:hypothetical protein
MLTYQKLRFLSLLQQAIVVEIGKFLTGILLVTN